MESKHFLIGSRLSIARRGWKPVNAIKTKAENRAEFLGSRLSMDCKLVPSVCLLVWYRLGAIQKVCHRPRGEGVKQNSDVTAY